MIELLSWILVLYLYLSQSFSIAKPSQATSAAAASTTTPAPGGGSGGSGGSGGGSSGGSGSSGAGSGGSGSGGVTPAPGGSGNRIINNPLTLIVLIVAIIGLHLWFEHTQREIDSKSYHNPSVFNLHMTYQKYLLMQSWKMIFVDFICM